jgi:hypothetical protein
MEMFETAKGANEDPCDLQIVVALAAIEGSRVSAMFPE